MYLINVDIQSGQVRENRIQEYWVQEPVRRHPQGAASHPAPAAPCCRPGKDLAPETKDPGLRARVLEFSSNMKKLSNSWQEDELYRLAVLLSRQQTTLKQAAHHLGRTPDACKYMSRKLKKAGVI